VLGGRSPYARLVVAGHDVVDIEAVATMPISVGLLLMQLIFNVIVFENGRGTILISSSWDPSSEAPSC
jgi:hypothetical protein